ncbi:MAG: ArsR family transcriptional regulator [Anaerolineae bacterium]|nr:ArsR family transcriptional regulator [Anaerolineae bacterium]
MNDILTGPPDFIKLLAPEIRWQIIKALQFSDHRVQELVDLLQQPKNLLSYHLKHLRDEALVTYRRSDADRRDYYYSLNVPHLQTLYQQTGEALHLASLGEATTPSYHWTPPVRVLYLCTRNSARSQMAEGLLRYFAKENALVASAGSEPASVHPLAVQVMAEMGIDISQQHSKSLDHYVKQSFDYVITVCDHVREICPTFPGEMTTIHWSFADPVLADDATRLTMFRATAAALANRIQYFMNILQSEREY